MQPLTPVEHDGPDPAVVLDQREGEEMNLATRIRRALCRHDWNPMYRQHGTTIAIDHGAAKCRKCGALRKAES